LVRWEHRGVLVYSRRLRTPWSSGALPYFRRPSLKVSGIQAAGSGLAGLAGGPDDTRTNIDEIGDRDSDANRCRTPDSWEWPCPGCQRHGSIVWNRRKSFRDVSRPYRGSRDLFPGYFSLAQPETGRWGRSHPRHSSSLCLVCPQEYRAYLAVANGVFNPFVGRAVLFFDVLLAIISGSYFFS
jgi:hypothetical protein